MIVNLLLDQTRTVDQMRAFVEGADLAEITHFDRDGAYALISHALERVLYPTLGKADKGVVLRFLEKAGLLSGAYRSPRQAAPPDRPHPGPPQKAPGKALHAPLHARRHRALGRGRRGLRPALSGPATKEILRRE